jgi:hypothetical protein
MEKYGFVYIWYDVKHKRYYVGCHWGTETDGYICSSNWMRDSYKRRPQDFRRKVLKTNLSREQMYLEEQRYLNMMKPEEKKIRYYNLDTKNGNPWHQYPESVKTIGQKISHSKKGKSTGPCSPETADKISTANKGRKFSEEHKEKLRQAKLGKKHTEEWKQQNSIRMKEQWNNGSRKRAEPKKTMTREEQDKLCSTQLKNRWSDPVWAENQKRKLKEASKKRWEDYRLNKSLGKDLTTSD